MARAPDSPPRIAITGVGMSTPFGGRESTWAAIREGRTALAHLLPGLYPGAEKDAGGLPPPEERAEHAERHLSYAVRAATEACKTAGLGEALRRDTACVIGTSKGGLAAWEAALQNPGKVGPHLLASAMPGMASVHAAERLALGGPRLSEAASCATGAACLRLAARLLLRGECAAVCAGASDASLTPLALGCYRALGVVADGPEPARACRPFDPQRRGFLPGEGAGALVLETEQAARRREARILGYLLAAVSGAEGHHETAPEPSGAGLAHALHAALAQAGVPPEEVDFIHAHGTATHQGDAAEAAALRRVFRRCPPVAATKPNTGHLLGASSAVEAGLALLALRDGFLPGVLNCGQLDADCRVIIVPREGLRGRFDIGVCLSAGFGGQVGVVVLKRG